MVSVSFREPIWAGDRWAEGEIKNYAWPFDQGPVLGKPGKPYKVDPETKVHAFEPIDEAEQARILAAMSKVLGVVFTPSDIVNLGPEEYARLIGWIDRRDTLIMQNSKHDMHQFRVGLRADAGGHGNVEGFAAWDVDSEPGQWRLGVSQRIELMDPSNEPLIKAKRRRRVFDTMLTQKQLVDPLEVSSLKPTSVRLFGAESDEDEVRLKAELSKLGTMMTKRYDLVMWQGAMGTYAWADTFRTLKIREYEVARVEEGSVLPDFKRLEDKEMHLRTTLYRMERRGVPYDAEASAAEGLRLREWNKAEALKFPFDVTKPNAAKRYYFGPECPLSSDAARLAWARVTESEMSVTVAERNLQMAREACVPGRNGKVAQTKINKVGVEERKLAKAQLVCTELRLAAEWQDALLAMGSHGICPPECHMCGGKNGLGFEPLSYTNGGEAQLDELAIQHLAAEGAPFALEYREYKKRQKTGNDWCTNWAAKVGPDGFIRTDYRQTVQQADKPGGGKDGGVKSGRLSCTRWGALQIPKKDLIPEGALPVRGFIGCEDDYDLYEHDLATGEFRVAVVLAGIYRLWDALDQGLDVHAMNAKALFGVTEDNPKFKRYRQVGKGGTFCILYGGGVMALKDQLEKGMGEPVSKSRAAQIKNSFFQTYPEFKAMTDAATRKVDRSQGGPGFLTMLDGWRRWYGYNEKTNSAFNQIIQGNLARACIEWMIAVERELPGVLLLQIHDSLITRHPKNEKGRRDAARVSEIGNEVFERYFKLEQRGNRIMNFGIEPELWSPYK